MKKFSFSLERKDLLVAKLDVDISNIAFGTNITLTDNTVEYNTMNKYGAKIAETIIDILRGIDAEVIEKESIVANSNICNTKVFEFNKFIAKVERVVDKANSNKLTYNVYKINNVMRNQYEETTYF